jgi:hypothetical protein
MSYVTEKHGKALSRTRERGAPVTFYRINSEDTITGYAVELPGDPEEYAALELIQRNPATLFFVPDHPLQADMIGLFVEWAGRTRIVDKRFPIRPTGVMIAARLIVL